MRIILLSDVHGNYEALKAVRDEIKEMSPDKVYCLGDVVGYGADPEACWRTIAEEGWETVLGNHDEAILDPAGISLMNPVARAALEWTKQNVSEEGVEWLKLLPDEIEIPGDGLASHALPIEPRRWLYSDNPRAVVESFDTRRETSLWVGHLHYAHAWRLDGNANRLVALRTPDRIELENDRWMFNVGSVGQPRDGDHRACYVLYRVEDKIVEYRRVQYDTMEAARKIVDAGLPDVLARRLFLGQ